MIKGWDDGLLGICPGEKRKLTIPSRLGYGDMGAGDRIPPKSTLIFEVECIGLEDGPAPQNIFKEIDTDNDNQLSREELSEYLKNQVPAGEGNPDQDKLVEDIFQHEDQDKNGYISHEEFSGPKHDELWAVAEVASLFFLPLKEYLNIFLINKSSCKDSCNVKSKLSK